MKYKTEKLFNEVGLQIEFDDENELIYTGQYMNDPKNTPCIIFNKRNHTLFYGDSNSYKIDLKLSDIINEQLKELKWI